VAATRKARCWVCGAEFDAPRGTLTRGALHTCERCTADGLAYEGSIRPEAEEVARILAERHGVGFVDPEECTLDREALIFVPEEFAELHSVLPLEFRPAKRELVVAMVDPRNAFAIESIRRRTGLSIIPLGATWDTRREAIHEWYGTLASADEPVVE
jgi:hypothetical protein